MFIKIRQENLSSLTFSLFGSQTYWKKKLWNLYHGPDCSLKIPQLMQEMAICVLQRYFIMNSNYLGCGVYFMNNVIDTKKGLLIENIEILCETLYI